ncbi:MAG: hypothetical protein ACKO3I_01345 [Synechococcales cyanobacterium]
MKVKQIIALVVGVSLAATLAACTVSVNDGGTASPEASPEGEVSPSPEESPSPSPSI